MTEEERIRVMIITTLSGLDATYEHYKGQFPPGSQGVYALRSQPLGTW